MRRYGVIGVGKMGGSLVRNLHRAGGQAVVFDLDRQAAAGLTDLARQLAPPRVIWIMVPAGEPVDGVIEQLRSSLTAGDVLIDGGNSHYRDSMRRADSLREAGVHYLDCGSSGGMEA